MSYFRFRSITVELIILFVALLIITTVLAVGYRTLLRTETLNALEAIRIADRIAVIASLLEDAQPEHRSDLVRNFQGSNMPVVLAQHSWVEIDATQDAQTKLLHDMLATSLSNVSKRDVRVTYLSDEHTLASTEAQALSLIWRQAKLSGPSASIVDQLASDPTFLVSLRLTDGTWVNVVAAYAVTLDFWQLEEIIFIGLMVIVIAGLSVWAIRRLTSPFRVFAQAAVRLGGDVQAPPLRETGPVEVRTAIEAFNGMQKRLQRFLDDRTQMLAAISHDLRTPITRLRLRAEFIDDPAQRSKHLADLAEMEQMIAEILSFVKEEASGEQTVRVDLVALLQSICDEISDRGDCATFVGQGRLPYECRRLALRRLLTNLIDNAVKYGGRAEVSVELTRSDVRVYVDDSGPGIPLELQELAFRPFHRLDPSRSRETGGASLGLAVARSIARAHGGDVTLANRPEGGLRATVALPVHLQPNPRALGVKHRTRSGRALLYACRRGAEWLGWNIRRHTRGRNRVRSPRCAIAHSIDGLCPDAGGSLAAVSPCSNRDEPRDGATS